MSNNLKKNLRKDIGADLGGDILPLTEAQLGIWLGKEMSPTPALYNAVEITEFTGDFREKIFTDALHYAYSEIEALHVVFIEVNDAPVMKRVQHDIYVESFESKELKTIEDVKAWAGRWALKEINLASEPPFKNAIVKFGNQHFAWVQCIHHIVCDGYAFALMSKRVAEIYQNMVNKCVIPESPYDSLLKVIEEDVAYQSSPRCEKNRQFWMEHCKHRLPPVSLADELHPISKSAIKRGARFSASYLEDIKAVSDAHASRWTEFLLASVIAYLAKQSASREITVGVPAMGRMGSASLRVPMMVMNINPISVHIPESNNFTDLLKAVCKEVAATRAHQKYRYEKITRDLNQTGRRLFGPVVNIMPFDRSLDWGNCSATLHPVSSGPVEDLSFSFIVTPSGGLEISLDANPDNYDCLDSIFNEYIESLKQAVYHVDSITLTPDVTGLSYLSTPRQEKLVKDKTTVLALIENVAKNNGDKCAVMFSENSVTYRQLLIDVNTLAGALCSFESMPGSVVVLMMERGYEAVATCLAVLKAGASYVFIDPKSAPERSLHILQEVSPSVVVFGSAVEKTFDLSLPQISYEQLILGKIASNSSPDEKLPPVLNNAPLPSDRAYIIYTSGSTGKPKGVVVSHQSVLEFVTSAITEYAFSSHDRVLQFAPLQFDTFVEEVFCTLCVGASLVIRGEDDIASTELFLNQCQRYGITILDLPTAYWHELVYSCYEGNTKLPACINTLIIGGEAASTERIHQWFDVVEGQKVRLLNTYGPSEATVVATFSEVKKDSTFSIGRPLSGRSIAIVGDRLQLKKIGESGELLLGGEGLADGYLHLPDQTKANFINSPFFCVNSIDESSRRFYRTGDRARINEDGNLEYLGRIDNEIKISGHRIQPLEVEHALQKLPIVEEAAVCIEDKAARKFLVAFVVVSDHASNDDATENEELKQALSSQIKQELLQVLPEVMVPSRILFLEKMPLSPTGKIDRNALLQTISDSTLTSVEQQDFDENEHRVFEIWSEVLGHGDFKKDDDFFSVGGYSLSAIQVANRLSKIAKSVVSKDVLFTYPTIQMLTQALFSNQNDSSYKRTNEDIKNIILADSQLDTQVFPPVNGKLSERRGEPRLILLTGATGFVGIQLLKAIVESCEATIVCLIRAKDEFDAEKKLLGAMKQQGISIDRWQSRVAFAIGDLTQENLGLGASLFHSLAESCDLVIHNGAKVSVMQDYQSLKTANLNATRYLLALCKKRLIPLHFISTISTALNPNTAIVKEEFVPFHAGLKDGYQRSKWASEHYLEQAANAGYPAYVHRLGRVTGALSTGYVNANDLIWNIIRACVKHNAIPELHFDEPWTPVDELARHIMSTIYGTSAQNDLSDVVFNHLPTHLVDTNKILHYVGERIGVTTRLSMKEWLDVLSASADDLDQALCGFFSQREKSNETPQEEPQEEKAGNKNVLRYESERSAYKGTRIDENAFECYWRYWKKHYNTIEVSEV